MSLPLTAIPNHDLRQLLADFIPAIEIEYGRKHYKARHPITRDFVPIPSTPSDRRARANLRLQLQRLITTGKGLIAAKKRA